MPEFAADGAEIQRFVASLFRYADEGTFVSLRGFDQVDSKRPIKLNQPVAINGDLSKVADVATTAAEELANEPRAYVFAPPICTFTNPSHARLADLANGLAISVEIDEGDTAAARQKLEFLLGQATLIIASGGEWSDPGTGEIHPKLHLHWRLSEPTRESADHERLRQVRDLAARLVGADPTGKPVVHPLRWPGSWNHKGKPRLAHIIADHPDAEINLDEAIERITEAVEAAGLAAADLPKSGTPEAPIDLVTAAMAHIPNPGADVHYDTWVKLGYAVHRATGGVGFQIWDDWSQKSTKYNAAETEAAWRRISHAVDGVSAPITVGAGTIIFMAKAAGWERPKPDRHAKQDQAKPIDPASPPAIPIIRFGDIQPTTDTLDFVENLLGLSAMSVVYGESNSGKTFWCTNLALFIAAGWEWSQRAVDRYGVIYCALEGSHGIKNRVAAFKVEYGLGEADLPFGVVTVALNILAGDDTSALIDAINAEALAIGFKTGLIVMDTLSRAMAGGNENAPDDMGALVRNGDLIRQGTGAHLMWVHHSGKDQAKGARGHSLLRAATDTEIEISAEGSARMARVTKQREFECSGVFPFSLKVIEIGTNRRGKPITSCVVVTEDERPPEANVRRHLTGHRKRALEVLQDLIAGSGRTGDTGIPAGCHSIPDQWWRDAFYAKAAPGAEQGTKQRTFHRAANELVESHIVGMANSRVWIASHDISDDGAVSEKTDV